MDPGVIRNGDKIIVQVSAYYEPIISVVPIEPLEIVSSSARSFLISVPIVGSALPTSFSAETSTPSLAPTLFNTTFTPTIAELAYIYAPSSNSYKHAQSQHHPHRYAPTHTDLYPIADAAADLHTQHHTDSDQLYRLTGVTHDPLEFKDNIMKMRINNQTGHTLIAANIYVEWNHDTGHGKGNDLGLQLRRVSLASQAWDGELQTPSAYIPAFYPSIPPGISIIEFIFHQDYQFDRRHRKIIISIGTPGCINYPVIRGTKGFFEPCCRRKEINSNAVKA